MGTLSRLRQRQRLRIALSRLRQQSKLSTVNCQRLALTVAEVSTFPNPYPPISYNDGSLLAV